MKTHQTKTNKKVIHLVSDISQINFGIWNVVIATFPYLEEQGWEPEIWFPESDRKIPEEIKKWSHRGIGKLEAKSVQPDFLQSESGLLHHSSIFVSHGCWSWATKMGYTAQKAGYKWIAVPHGMLEPWSMKQKKLKKQLYFKIIEKRYLQKADAIVAVGGPEHDNLRKWFKNVQHIPNGIEPFTGSLDHSLIGSSESKNNSKSLSDRLGVPPFTFLFLSRLHYKKGVVPLVKAWLSSNLSFDDCYQLLIAGPDEGELAKVKSLLESGEQNSKYIRNAQVSNIKTLNSNIRIMGPVYGNDKEKLLLGADFFILPSQSEGFPTSILEAMTYGCIPIFTNGCNFPEPYEKGVGIRIKFDVGDIMGKLEEVAHWPEEKRNEMSLRSKEFVDKNYNWKDIAGKQLKLYEKVIGDKD